MKAQGLLSAITAFTFLVSFTVVSKIMSVVQPLTVALQERALDVCRAYEQVTNVMQQLKQMRHNVEEKHEEWWKEAVERARNVNVEPALPRRCGRQTQRDNTPGNTPVVYFRRVITAPLLDEVIAHGLVLCREWGSKASTLYLMCSIVISPRLKSPYLSSLLVKRIACQQSPMMTRLRLS